MSDIDQHFDPAPANVADEPTTEKLLSANFIFAMVANFFNAIGVQMMNSTIPVYVLSMGGNNAQAGLVGGALTLTSLLLRPLMGWISDVWRRRPLAVLGSAAYGVASIVYALSNSIGMLVFGRVIHGVGLSSYSTASNAYIVDISPPKRRTEGIGLFAATNSLGLIVGPAIGFFIVAQLGFHRLFNFATALAVVALTVSLFAREQRRPKHDENAVRTQRIGVLTDALPIAWIALCLGSGLGAVSTFIAIFATSRGIGNPGLYFTVQAITLLISRLFFGRIADRRGHSAAIIPGIIAMSVSLVALPFAHSLTAFLVRAALFGLGLGTAQPATMSLLADHVRPEQRGLGMATYFMGFDGGHFLGSILYGVASEAWGFNVMWPLSALVTLLGLVGLLSLRRSGKFASMEQHGHN